jgi:hypothetical protein
MYVTEASSRFHGICSSCGQRVVVGCVFSITVRTNNSDLPWRAIVYLRKRAPRRWFSWRGRACWSWRWWQCQALSICCVCSSYGGAGRSFGSSTQGDSEEENSVLSARKTGRFSSLLEVGFCYVGIEVAWSSITVLEWLRRVCYVNESCWKSNCPVADHPKTPLRRSTPPQTRGPLTKLCDSDSSGVRTSDAKALGSTQWCKKQEREV